jgi:hypothetical protein
LLLNRSTIHTLLKNGLIGLPQMKGLYPSFTSTQPTGIGEPAQIVSTSWAFVRDAKKARTQTSSISLKNRRRMLAPSPLAIGENLL